MPLRIRELTLTASPPNQNYRYVYIHSQHIVGPGFITWLSSSIVLWSSLQPSQAEQVRRTSLSSTDKDSCTPLLSIGDYVMVDGFTAYRQPV